MSVTGIPSYRNLDQSGEASAAATRMEARARAIASEGLFQELVAPLLLQGPQHVLEIGCGTAALTRRMAEYLPKADYFATDLSDGMLASARDWLWHDGLTRAQLGQWDVHQAEGFPFDGQRFDLIISSVVIPYLDRIPQVVENLASRLHPGGLLVFVEQDLQTDSLYFPDDDLRTRVFAKDRRQLSADWGLGLRPALKAAGLKGVPRKSYLWTDELYGAYSRDLLGGFADAAFQDGRISQAERENWDPTLHALTQQGDFYYGLVYHRVGGKKA